MKPPQEQHLFFEQLERDTFKWHTHTHWQIHKLTSCWRPVSAGWTPPVHCCSPFFLCLHLWHPGSLSAAMKSQTRWSILIITWKQCTMLSFLCLHLSHPGSHFEHRFPAPSSKLCQNWLRHWRGTLYLRAAVHRRCQGPPNGLGTNNTDKTVEEAYRRSTRVNTRRVRYG